jgi:hypothetical protein
MDDPVTVERASGWKRRGFIDGCPSGICPVEANRHDRQGLTSFMLSLGIILDQQPGARPRALH